jgi:cytochrome c
MSPRKSLAFLTAFALMAAASATQAQSVEAGQKIFRQRCMSCHGLGAVAAYSPGPALAGVFNRPIASLQAYEYSDGLKKVRAAWTADRLDAWLKDPAAFAPGAAMPQALPDAQERADVVAYLKTLQ